jgi:hypothetical protein
MIIGCNLDAIPGLIGPLVVYLHNRNGKLREEIRHLRRMLFAEKS